MAGGPNPVYMTLFTPDTKQTDPLYKKLIEYANETIWQFNSTHQYMNAPSSKLGDLTDRLLNLNKAYMRLYGLMVGLQAMPSLIKIATLQDLEPKVNAVIFTVAPILDEWERELLSYFSDTK